MRKPHQGLQLRGGDGVWEGEKPQRPVPERALTPCRVCGFGLVELEGLALVVDPGPSP